MLLEIPQWLLPAWNNILEITGLITSAFVLWLFKIAFSKYKQTKFYNDLYSAVEIGVQHTQEDFVDWAKKASQDGKLTKEERTQALNMALEKAKEFAATPAIKTALMEITKEELQVLVRKILDKSNVSK